MGNREAKVTKAVDRSDARPECSYNRIRTALEGNRAAKKHRVFGKCRQGRGYFCIE